MKPILVIHPTHFEHDLREKANYHEGLHYLNEVDIELDKPTIEKLIPILKDFLHREKGAKRIRFIDNRPGVNFDRKKQNSTP